MIKFKVQKGTKLNDETITINKVTYNIKTGYVYHEDLSFWDENPRTYASISDQLKTSQDKIYGHLKALEDVRRLKDDIVENGGLTDALIVRGDNGVVIEGNRRLAALRLIFETDGAPQWAVAKVAIFPKNTPEDAYFSLIGNYHIKGKKQWTPFEQAGYIYRRSKIPGITVEGIAAELKISVNKCKHLINVYGYMEKNNFKDPIQWSYFDEFLKSNHINELREKAPQLDKVFNKQVRSGKIEKADNVRKQLAPLVNKGAPKLVNRFIKGELTLGEAHEINSASGNLNEVVNKFRRFRKFISEKDQRQAIVQSDKNLRKKMDFELNKIIKLCKDLISK